jgi:phytoene dehydrogenase-like protein
MSIDPFGQGMSRRSFLIKGSLFIASAAGGIISCRKMQPGKERPINGAIKGEDRKAGHMLLDREDLVPRETKRAGIVIVGGGISGLSAARDLRKNRFDDFLLLELAEKTGGNAVGGANPVSPYPWGAHYVPIPNDEAVLVKELFEELGIIEGYAGNGLPVYNEFYLCADPQERLFIHGQWQDGLIPQLGISDRDRRQYEEFFQTMKQFKEARGKDGRRAFAIPIERSSKDGRFRKYDSISMDRYLSENGWDSEYLRWYVNYCCRDDYGSLVEETSAWAGIHYFASRAGRAANADSHSVLTWPEGLGWIVNKMEEKVKDNILCNACVRNIENIGDDLAVDYYDLRRGVAVRILAGTVIYAAPRFTAFRAVKSLREKLPAYAASFAYAPWMVANITMKGVPEDVGAPLSWDNVSYQSNSLGYVVANHQDVAVQREKSVLTYYFPLTSGDPAEERKKAVKRDYKEWAGMVLQDLSRMHPGIEDRIEELNVWLWGHAMIKPSRGFMWGTARNEALKPFGKIFFAHSDMSGISIFEEAQYRGVMASRAALKAISTKSF